MTLPEAKAELEKFVKLKTTLRPTFVDVLLAADVQEVRHGHWVWGMQDLCYYCSECDYMGVTEEYPYCPNCGAKMVKEDDDTD